MGRWGNGGCPHNGDIYRSCSGSDRLPYLGKLRSALIEQSCQGVITHAAERRQRPIQRIRPLNFVVCQQRSAPWHDAVYIRVRAIDPKGLCGSTKVHAVSARALRIGGVASTCVGPFGRFNYGGTG